jgi:16S rRNA processing protein RimM
MATRLVVIGEIGRPHGLRGELRVVPHTDDPARFEGLATCVLWVEARDEREARRITGARRQGDVVILGLEGCDSAEAAAALVGRLVAVPESEARPLPDGQFYPWQLEGCRVVTEEGHEVGAVTRIDANPGHDLWVVQGAGGREHLIPAVPAIVREVDLAARRVVIAPPEGLLEL